MKRTTKMVVYGLAVAALLGTTLAETSMAGKRGKKRPKKSARSGKDIGGHLMIESTGTRKDPKRTTGKRGKKRPKKSARSGKDPFSDAGFEPGIRKAPKSTTVKRGKKRPKKSVLGFPFSLRRKAR